MPDSLRELKLIHGQRALVAEPSKDAAGQPRVLLVTSTPEDGALPLLSLERDEVLQLHDWLTRWLVTNPGVR